MLSCLQDVRAIESIPLPGYDIQKVGQWGEGWRGSGSREGQTCISVCCNPPAVPLPLPQEGGNTLVLRQVTSVRGAGKSKRETHRLRVEEGDVGM